MVVCSPVLPALPGSWRELFPGISREILRWLCSPQPLCSSGLGLIALDWEQEKDVPPLDAQARRKLGRLHHVGHKLPCSPAGVFLDAVESDAAVNRAFVTFLTPVIVTDGEERCPSCDPNCSGYVERALVPTAWRWVLIPDGGPSVGSSFSP